MNEILFFDNQLETLSQLLNEQVLSLKEQIRLLDIEFGLDGNWLHMTSIETLGKKIKSYEEIIEQIRRK